MNYNVVMKVKDLWTDCNDIFGKTRSAVPVANNIKNIYIYYYLLGFIRQA